MAIITVPAFVLMLLVATACGDTQSASTNPPSTMVSTEVTGDSNQTPQVGLTPGASSSDQPPGTVSPSPSQSVQPGAANQNQRLFDHVFIIVLENADYDQAIAQPFLHKLAGQGALLSNYSGVAHPSYPNYLALVGGSTFGINDDAQVNLDQTTVVDLMAKKGVSWKFYAEQYPANQCFTGSQSGNYVRKHLPILSFVAVQKDPALCNRVVPSGQLTRDMAAGNLPNYSFYVPDLKNDGHDTGIAFASKWLEGFLTGLTNDPKFSTGTLVVVTFDESENYGNNRIYTVLMGPAVKPGSTSNVHYTHYDLLRTIEDNFQLGNLGRADARANPITGVWQVQAGKGNGK